MDVFLLKFDRLYNTCMREKITRLSYLDRYYENGMLDHPFYVRIDAA